MFCRICLGGFEEQSFASVTQYILYGLLLSSITHWTANFSHFTLYNKYESSLMLACVLLVQKIALLICRCQHTVDVYFTSYEVRVHFKSIGVFTDRCISKVRVYFTDIKWIQRCEYDLCVAEEEWVGVWNNFGLWSLLRSSLPLGNAVTNTTVNRQSGGFILFLVMVRVATNVYFDNRLICNYFLDESMNRITHFVFVIAPSSFKNWTLLQTHSAH